jgi:autotransporter-associated beta strand protein
VAARPLSRLAALLVALAAPGFWNGNIRAASYDWILDNNGNWNTQVNWSPSTGFPNGIDDIARFDLNITANRTVTQNIAAVGGVPQVTLGSIYFRDPDNTHGFTISTNTIRMQASIGPAVIESASGGGQRHIVSTALQLASDLELRATVGELRIGAISESDGPRNLLTTGAGTVNVFGNWAYAGATTVTAPNTVNPGALDRPTAVRGLFSFGEPSGFISATSGFTLQNSELRMGSVRDTTVNRLPDTAPIQMTRSQLTYNGDLASTTLRNVRETYGALTLQAGLNVLQSSFASVTGYQQVTELVGSSLTRGAGRPTALIRGASLGSSNSGGNGLGASRIFFETDPTSSLVGGGGTAGTSTISILPYAIGGTTTSSANTFVTYDPTATVVQGISGDPATDRAGKIGFRPLDTSTEFVTALTGASSSTNVRRTSAETASSAVVANSLVLVSATTLTLNGGLTLTSGALLYNGSAGQQATITGSAGAAIAASDGRELVVHVVNTGTSGTSNLRTTLTIDQVITAAGGLTFGALTLGNTGPQSLRLTRTNTYAGQTTVNGGILTVDATGTLGSGSVFVRNGGWLELLTPSAIAESAGLTIDDGGLAKLDFSGSNLVGSLTLGGAIQTVPGTYGSTASGATHTYDDYFTGAGTITIVPEPATGLLMLAAGLASAVAFRRRSRRAS